MKNRAIQSGILTVLIVLLVGGTAGVASGEVLFSDNFDNVTPGSLPLPTVGTLLNTWYMAKAGTGLATAPSPPNYLDNYRLDGSGINGYRYGVDLDGPAQTFGTHIHAEFQNYAVSGTSYWILGLASNDYIDQFTWNYIMQLAGDASGNVLAYDGGSNWNDTLLDYTPDTWQKWEIDYVVGVSSYTLTVGDNSTVLSGSSYMVDPNATQAAMFILDGGGPNVQNLLDDVLVVSVAAEGVCGDYEHPYPVGDLDQNCLVDIADIAMLAERWLLCTHPDCD